MKSPFPRGVTSIEGIAFGRCTRLTDITLPESVSSMDSNVFSVCLNSSDLTIYVPAGSCAERIAKLRNIPFVAD